MSDEVLAKIQSIDFYVVMNSDGQFFRAKGYGGSGSSWVDSLDTARIYAKIGPARNTVTFFATNYPDYPRPTIVKLSANATEIIDEKERVDKAIARKKKRDEDRLKSKGHWVWVKG